MFPESTELPLVDCLIESIWTPRSKSNTLTPKTNSQTYWPSETSHVMNGIICWPCLILAILALLLTSQRWRKRAQQYSGEGRVTAKITTYDEFDRKNAFVRVFFSFRKPRGGPRMDIKILNNLFLTIERGNPSKRQDQTIHRIMVPSWSSQVWKSGNGEHDRSGKPEQNSWDSLQKVDPHREEYLLGRTAHFCKERRNYSRKNGRDPIQNRIHLEPKIQIKYIDTKNQLADILTNGNFHTWWNGIIFCVCLTLAISVLQIVLKWCRKRTQKDSGKDRVTA